jgi:hypothetical protein
MKQEKKENPSIQKIPFAIIFFFLLLLMSGLTAGEESMVLEQAIKVCLSCIGIG